MSKLSLIISNEKAILEREAIIKPIQIEVDTFKNTNDVLIGKFLEEVMIKFDKYYLEGYNLEWISCKHINIVNRGKGHEYLFYCEFKSMSNTFEEYLTSRELYEVFKYSTFYKELVRESAIESVIE